MTTVVSDFWNKSRHSISGYIHTLYVEDQALSQISQVLSLVIRMGTMLAFYVGLEWWIRHAGHLSLSSYQQPVILIELLKNLFETPLLAAGTIILLGTGAVRVQAIWNDWSFFDNGQRLRVFVLCVVAIAAWTFSTYDYNLYFNQSHFIDRLALLVLALLSWRKPVFVLPFVLLLVAIVWQLDYPLVGLYPWTEMNLVFHTLALFGVFFLIHVLTGTRRTADFIFLLCCLVASSYWGSGLGKLRLDWINHPHLHLLPMGAYTNGWLGFLPPETIVSLVKFVTPFTLPLMLFTLFVEWGVITLLWKRNLTIIFLLSFIVFHAGIFLYTGMFFWKWILLEVALLFCFFLRKPTLSIYTRWHFLLSLALIGGSTIWFRPTNLSWYDTRLSYSYRVEAIGKSGERYALPIGTFAPYNDVFTLGNLAFLNPEPQLLHIWDVTPIDELETDLRTATQPEQIYELERQYAIIFHDQTKIEMFDDFMTLFFQNLNHEGVNRAWWNPVRAPRHLWSFPRNGEVIFEGQEPIVRVKIYQVTALYDDEQYSIIRKRAVREINIPDGDGDV